MKKTITAILAALTLTLTACSGHSAANKEQISNAKQEAEEMLERIHNDDATATPTPTDSISATPEIN